MLPRLWGVPWKVAISWGLGGASGENICSQLDLREDREEPKSGPGHRGQSSRCWIPPISKAWWVGWTCAWLPLLPTSHISTPHCVLIYPACAFLCDVRSMFDFVCLGFSTSKTETVILSTSVVLTQSDSRSLLVTIMLSKQTMSIRF